MTEEIVTTRPVAYTIEDKVFDEPFEVYESANAWWMERGKVERLIEAFKRFLMVKQAIILAGISADQYKYFMEIHPKFSTVKERCREVVPMFAKGAISDAVTKDWKAASWFLERVEPETFGRRQDVPLPPLEAGGSVQTLIQESFMDASGKVIMKRKTAQLIEDERNTTTTTDGSNGEEAIG